MSITVTDPGAAARLLRLGDHDDSRISKHDTFRGLRGTDQLLADRQEPPLGAHLVTPRRGYLHHGIYVGDRQVVHYAGLAHGLRGGAVEEVSLARFARGQRLWIRPGTPSDFEVPEVIGRARSRVGEDGYRLLTNNCEHFCEWCLCGTARSFQVEAWLARPRHVLQATLRLLIQSITQFH